MAPDVDKTIFAKKGMIVDNKLILLNGTIQNLNDRKINNFNFKKTELSISNFNTRIIKKNKIQETSSYKLLVCLLNNNSLICPYKNNKINSTNRNYQISRDDFVVHKNESACFSLWVLR